MHSQQILHPSHKLLHQQKTNFGGVSNFSLANCMDVSLVLSFLFSKRLVLVYHRLRHALAISPLSGLIDQTPQTLLPSCSFSIGGPCLCCQDYLIFSAISSSAIQATIIVTFLLADASCSYHSAGTTQMLEPLGCMH